MPQHTPQSGAPNHTITITVNGKPLTIPTQTTLYQLLFQILKLPQNQHFAVAINKKVIQPPQWTSHQLQNGDHILIVHPIQGG